MKKIGFFEIFIRQKAAEDIVNIDLNENSYCAIMKWLPVVELDFGQERALTEDPNISFRNGRFHRVPIIAGITANEYNNPVPSIFPIFTIFMTSKYLKSQYRCT